MKKIFKKIMFVVMASAMAFGFAACNDDDDDESTSVDSKVVGTWETVSMELDGEDLGIHVEFELKSNGTGYSSSVDNPNKKDKFEFSTTGSTLKLVINGNTYTYQYDIRGDVMSIVGQGVPGESMEGTFVGTFKKKSSSSATTVPANMVGTWQATTHTVGTSTVARDIRITIYSDFSGIVSDEGVTENNDFDFTLSGNNMYVTPRHGGPGFAIPFTYSINGNTMVLSGEYGGPVDLGAGGAYSATYTKIAK